MFDRFTILSPKIPESSTSFIQQAETVIKKNQGFFQAVQRWRNLQISYIGKLAELQCDIDDKDKNYNDKATNQLGLFFQLLIDNHKALINKLNHDIFLANVEVAKPFIAEQKLLLDSERIINKEIVSKKQVLDKVLNKKIKIKKQMEQQQTLQIFSQDSYDQAMDKRMKRFNKMKQISKEQQQYQIKVKDTKQMFDKLIQKSKKIIDRFNRLTSDIRNQKQDAIIKLELHALNYAKNIQKLLEQKCKKISENDFHTCSSPLITNKFISDQEENLKKIDSKKDGYLETCLKIITEKSIDEIIEYSKDNQIKKRIKKIIESTSINPQDTDELTRQVQLVKKILASNGQSPCLQQFKHIITKNSKFRMNFVFILQFNRLNSKFQIKDDKIKPMLILIKQLLDICHEYRDSFVLKQLMILLTTYFIMLPSDQEGEIKLYILSFFKERSLWKDIELWQSILIQCIYIEKKATLRMILITSSTSNRSQLIQAEKTSVLNQILYIVRNMLMFDFSEREVKQFANRFVKLMKQDERFLKDVHKSIDTAVLEEKQTMNLPNTNKKIQQMILNIFGPPELS